MRHILLAAAVLATTPASAGQILVPTARGPVYATAYRYSGPPPWMRGYVRPYRPNPGVIIGGAIAGALAAMPRPVLPPPVPVQRPVAAPLPDAMDEIVPVNAQGVTRQ